MSSFLLIYSLLFLRRNHLLRPILLLENLILLVRILIPPLNKTLKTIGPLGNPEGNNAHRMYIIVSLEIDFMGDYNTQLFVL
jgi:hypothetical protein